MTQVQSQLGKQTYEAFVVGAGFGGGVAACGLAQAGLAAIPDRVNAELDARQAKLERKIASGDRPRLTHSRHGRHDAGGADPRRAISRT